MAATMDGSGDLIRSSGMRSWRASEGEVVQAWGHLVIDSPVIGGYSEIRDRYVVTKSCILCKRRALCVSSKTSSFAGGFM